MGTLLFFCDSLWTASAAVLFACCFTRQITQLVRTQCFSVIAFNSFVARGFVEAFQAVATLCFFLEPMVSSGGLVTVGGYVFVSSTPFLTVTLLCCKLGYIAFSRLLVFALCVFPASRAPPPPFS